MAGTTLGGVLGLLATLLGANILGPAKFGIVAIVMTYVALVDRLVNFQTWQALTQFGAGAQKRGDGEEFARLVRICTLLDAGTAMIGTVVAVLAAGLMVHLMRLEPAAVTWTMLFSIVILTNLSGVPVALLRLYDRFDRLALQELLQGTFALAAMSVVYGLKGGEVAVLTAFAISRTVGNLLLLASGWRELRRQGVRKVWRGTGRRDLVPPRGFLSFVFWTNVESSVKILREVDVFVIKALLSLEAVGLYYAGQRIAGSALGMISTLFYALHPEFAKLVAARDETGFRRLIVQGAAMGAVVSGILVGAFLLVGEPLLVFLLGEKFRAALPITVILLAGTAVWAVTLPLSPALFALRLVRQAFVIHLVVAILYLVALFPLIWFAGLWGAAIGYALFFAAWGAFAGFVVLTYTNNNGIGQKAGKL